MFSKTHIQNDSFVLVGNHRDAWTFGGADPNSGSSVLLEMVRAFGLLAKAGYKPERSLRFCSWDGEEYGLLGSTGYAVDKQDELQKGCLAYINTDVGVGGKSLVVGASPSLKRVFQRVLGRVMDPHTQKPLSQLYNVVQDASVLGSGSDYTVRHQVAGFGVCHNDTLIRHFWTISASRASILDLRMRM